jgi:hypothetical protein
MVKRLEVIELHAERRLKMNNRVFFHLGLEWIQEKE